MRKFILALALCMFTIVSFAQDKKVSIGLQVSPMLSWMRPDVSHIKRDGIRTGFGYGLALDYNLSNNYSLATGVGINHFGGRVSYDSLFVFESDSFGTGAQVTHKLQYFEIPIGIKLKTNEIGMLTYYLQIGLSTQWRFFKAKAIVNSINIDNYNKGAGFVNVALNIVAGTSYNLQGNTSMTVALFFKNGFTDMTRKEADDSNVFVNQLGLSLGLVF